MNHVLPATPSVHLSAGTSTGAGTSVALVEACRTLSTQVRDGRIGRAEVLLPDVADGAAATADGLSVVRAGRWGAIVGELTSRSDCDIYIGFADRLPLTPNQDQFRVMVVQNPHLYESSDAPSLGAVARLVRSRWARWSATNADLVVCATEASRTALLAAIPGVDPERVVVRPIRPSTPAAKTEVAETIRHVLLLGDLYAYKRFDVALDGITAWASTRSDPEALRVLHCGSPRDEPAVTDFEAAVGRARAAGITVEQRGAVTHDDAMAALLDSDVLVSASEVETQGLTILEALAVGVPVVARGIAPVLDVAGDAIKAFPVAGGPRDIATALTGIEARPERQELLRRGLDRAQMAAGWDLLPD